MFNIVYLIIVLHIIIELTTYSFKAVVQKYVNINYGHETP